jgi:hypothetical protein
LAKAAAAILMIAAALKLLDVLDTPISRVAPDRSSVPNASRGADARMWDGTCVNRNRALFGYASVLGKAKLARTVQGCDWDSHCPGRC